MRYLEKCFSEVELIQDIPFTEVINIQNEHEKIKLDMYIPHDDKETKRPIILWIHGGGFKPGRDKGQNYIVEFARRFALKGYVCVAPDYRVRENPWDDIIGTISNAVADVSSALDWVRNNNEAYGIDRERIFVAGGSAGGMIAVNMCYGDGSCGPKTDLSGVLAMMNLWGSPPDLRLDLHSNSIPALIVHGTADEMVKIENSYNFIDMLNTAGVKNVFIPLDGAPHTPMLHVENMDSEFSSFLSNILGRK